LCHIPKNSCKDKKFSLPAGLTFAVKIMSPESGNVYADELASMLESEFPAVTLLTGPAGSGKSTLIQYLREQVYTGMLLTAPTGIAALNIKGQTLHSVFRLPLGPLIPGDERLMQLRFRAAQLRMFRNMELLVIDEISMVRADTLDAVDLVLRNILQRDEPFGGKRVLLSGDPFQLPPVVTSQEMPLLRNYYEAPYFFRSRVIEQTGFTQFRLSKIFRQSDRGFIRLLEEIKRGELEEDGWEKLNARVQPFNGSEMGIILCTMRNQAEHVNRLRMEALPGRERIYTGILKDAFREEMAPVDPLLTLRENAQVMMVRNDPDKRWMNGSLARVHSLENDHIQVGMPDGKIHRVDPIVWENIEYQWDETRQQIKESVTGTYKQYPLKPAWAITIHKSQGLTFDRVHVDLGRQVFAPGQLYVALSRCTTLEGLSMERGLKPRDLLYDPALAEFAERL
jgi:ATP-dependent DNA helicase PIF1